MQRRWQYREWLLAALILGACAPDDEKPEEAPGKESGNISPSGVLLPLLTWDNSGFPYRLRNATFSIAPVYYDGGMPQATVFSTENYLERDEVSVDLVPGYYGVTLGGDWYLERQSLNGAQRVEDVVLLSNVQQWAYIADGTYYNELDFRFGVGGTLLDFRRGTLKIGISIEHPGEGPAHDGNLDGGGLSYPGYDAGVSVWDADGARQPYF